MVYGQFMNFWKKPDKNVLLASASPRRKQILTQMGFSFDVAIPEDFNEDDFLDSNNLEKSLQSLAVQKAESVAKLNPNALVLGADTIVIVDKTIFGKPTSYQNAFDMLKKLSGISHSVMTGVALLCAESGFKKTAIATTEVIFRSVPEHEIHEYLSSDEYCDKAGAYAIQGEAMVFVESIKGCFYNVVGLPVVCTIHLFNEYVVRKESTDV